MRMAARDDAATAALGGSMLGAVPAIVKRETAGTIAKGCRDNLLHSVS